MLPTSIPALSCRISVLLSVGKFSVQSSRGFRVRHRWRYCRVRRTDWLGERTKQGNIWASLKSMRMDGPGQKTYSTGSVNPGIGLSRHDLALRKNRGCWTPTVWKWHHRTRANTSGYRKPLRSTPPRARSAAPRASLRGALRSSATSPARSSVSLPTSAASSSC